MFLLWRHGYYTEAWWRIYTSVNCVIISSGNELSPIKHLAIDWTNTSLFSIDFFRTKFCEILMKIPDFISRKCIWKYRLQKVGHFGSSSMCYAARCLMYSMPRDELYSQPTLRQSPLDGSNYVAPACHFTPIKHSLTVFVYLKALLLWPHPIIGRICDDLLNRCPHKEIWRKRHLLSQSGV